MAINKNTSSLEDNTVPVPNKHYSDTEEEIEEGTMVLGEDSDWVEGDSDDGTDILDDEEPIINAVKNHYEEEDDEEMIVGEATTVLDDEDAFEEYNPPIVGTGSANSSGGTQKLVEHEQHEKIEYVSPEFDNVSGQGMFSKEEREKLEERRQLKQKESVKKGTMGTNVSLKLAEKLKRNPDEIKLTVYDDSSTAALYYKGSEQSSQSEEDFMNELTSKTPRQRNSRASESEEPEDYEELSETGYVRQGYNQINHQEEMKFKKHKMKNKQFSFDDNNQNKNSKGFKAKKSTGIQNLPIKIGIVVALIALAVYLFVL